MLSTLDIPPPAWPPPAICRWEPPSYLRRRQQKQDELTTLAPPDRRGPRIGGPLRALEAAPTGSAVDAGVGPGAPGPSHSCGLQAGSGAAAASQGPGCSASPAPLSGIAGIWILRKQSRSIACVLDSLSQQRKSSSTFIFRTGCRTLPGGISGARALLPEGRPHPLLSRAQVPGAGTHVRPEWTTHGIADQPLRARASGGSRALGQEAGTWPGGFRGLVRRQRPGGGRGPGVRGRGGPAWWGSRAWGPGVRDEAAPGPDGVPGSDEETVWPGESREPKVRGRGGPARWGSWGLVRRQGPGGDREPRVRGGTGPARWVSQARGSGGQG